MTTEEHIKELAVELANNHKKFDCFAWNNEPENSENFAIVYLSNRDSGILAKTNEKVIIDALNALEVPEETDDDLPDWWEESHSHWAVGHVDGVVLRVYDEKGNVTKAFSEYAKLKFQMDEYPVLDDEAYSEKELEATLDNIKSNLGRFDLKEEVDESEVYRWLSEHDPGAIESTDDQGGYPSDEQLKEALIAMGKLEEDEDEDEEDEEEEDEDE
jgi:hypothetical protein